MSEPAHPESAAREELDDRPPVLGSWRNIYVFVLGVLVILVLGFTALTEVFS